MSKVLFRAFSKKADAARASGVGIAFIYQGGTKSRGCPLETLLRIAYVGSVDLTDIMFGDIDQIKVEPRVLTIAPIVPKLRRRWTPDTLLQASNLVLEKNPELSTRGLAKELRICTTLLRTKCPELFSRLVKKRSAG